MKLVSLAIDNHRFTIIFILVLVLSGVVSFLTMPRSEDPQVAPNGASVVVFYPGASPADMEQLTVDPIERKINELDDIKKISSEARDGAAMVSVEFQSGVDMDWAYSEIVQKVNAIRHELPEDIAALTIQRWVLSDFVIVHQAALLSETVPFTVLEEEAERLEKELERIPGVKRVRIWGIPDREVRISVDLNRLAARRLSLHEIIQAVQSAGQNIPGGHLDMGGRRFSIRTSGPFASLEEIGDTVIRARGEKVVFLRDVADIRFDNADAQTFHRVDGRRGVFVTIHQKDGTNIFRVMEGVRTALASFSENLPAGIDLVTVFDQSESVAARLNAFFTNLLQGLVLVGLMILVAANIRSAVIVILAIPFSIFIALGFVDLSSYGLQQMTIAGLVIAIGLLVDNAIVVTENISRFIGLGYSPRDAAVKGTGQIGWAVASSTATTILAFVPVAMMGYVSGDYIRSMPVTVIFTLAASLLIALTLTPYLSSRFFTPATSRRESLLRRLLNRINRRAYRPVLDFALNRPGLILAGVAAVFLLSLALFGFVGVSFFPKAEKPQLIVNIETAEGSNLERTDRAVRRVEEILVRFPEIRRTAVTVGRGGPQIHYNVHSPQPSATFAQIYLELADGKPRTLSRVVAGLRREFEGFPDAAVEVKELEQGPDVEAPVAIKILGDDMDVLRRIGGDVEEMIRETPGTVNVENPLKTERIDLQIRINRAKAGMLGVPLVEIDRTVRAAIAGLPIMTYRDPRGKEYDIVIRLPFDGKPGIEDLDRITVTSMTGAQIPLGQVAGIEFRPSPQRIDHHNFERAVTVTADVDLGYSTDRVTRAVREKLDAYAWPRGVRFAVAGEAESREESFGGMGQAVVIALISIFAVLVLQFRSFLQPVIVFATIPLALIGSILALLVTGNTFSFTAFIGLTSLVGIVVNNAILLVDYTNKLRGEGRTPGEALREAGPVRFTPIILTTATTIGGLLPLTLRGGTLYAPMGWTLIGGLAVSTFLTLIVVPVLYVLLVRDNGKPAEA
jgi:multidrug efflux pump subunit AcrB